MYIQKDNQRRKCVMAICQSCGLEFSAVEKEVRRGGGKFCSRNCQRSYQARKNSENRRVDITRAERKERWVKSVSPEVISAHKAVESAISRGALVRCPCEICGATRVDAHHDDYSKPLNVRWLCRGHHLRHHRSIAGSTGPL